MILKFVCSNGSLRVFETDEIGLVSGEPITDIEEYRDLHDAIKIGDYQLFDNSVDEPVEPFKVLQFYDKKGAQRTVLFDSVVYLMNESGKTVDTIYGY